MNPEQRLKNICLNKLKDLNLYNTQYVNRLKEEFREAECQDFFQYFLDLYDTEVKGVENENNLLIPYLLEICNSFEINKEPAYVYGDWPDVDVDYIEKIRDHLKYVWAPERFGKDNICEIGTYSTYSLKNALLDMARIHDCDRNEALNITKNFDAKDDEGEPLTWETAVDLYPEFKKYIEKYPDVADAAKHMIGKTRNMGQHAGGFIIADRPLKSFLPIVLNKDFNQVSAWTEGQHSQDLQPVGLIKFDLLLIKTQEQIVDTIKLIRNRHGMEWLCRKQDAGNWSDINYLNDLKCMEMAAKGDTKFVFQFHSDGIRSLIREMKVDKFDDLVAANALFRPGPLEKKMHEAYYKRKTGVEDYETHPILKECLGQTYGVIVYQEQAMQVLNVVGGIPKRETYIAVKAISKKKADKIAQYKGQFVKHGQKVLSWSEEEVEKIFSNIQDFAGYAFNKAHSVEYAILACRQLYLKCYYPLEFYCSILNHIGGADRDEKIKECIQDAKAHSVEIARIDVNKSGADFEIIDDKIYYAISGAKFVGHEPAKKIVELRQEKEFAGLKDFLDRFGTEAKVIQALISLNCFSEADPMTLFRYFEYYKSVKDKNASKIDRFQDLLEKYKERFLTATGKDLIEVSINVLDEEIKNYQDPAILKEINKIKSLYIKSKDKYENAPDLDAVSVQEFIEKHDDPYVELDVKPEVIEGLKDKLKAEMMFYGFYWSHPLDETGNPLNTFEKYKTIWKVNPKAEYYVDGMIVDFKKVLSKKKTTYYLVDLGDRNWDAQQVTIWSDDYDRWKDQLVVGNVVSMELIPPNPKYGERYSLKSWPKWEQYKKPDKENDFRIRKIL